MKKILVILVIFISLFLVYKIRNNEIVKVVSINSTSFDLDSYNLFYLNMEDENITTNNLKKLILNDMKIISIIPYINPIYKEKVKNSKYVFTQESYKTNIDKMISNYETTIKNLGYIDNINYIHVSGLKIEEIEVYAKGSDIVNIIYFHPKIKYKNYLNGSYNYLPL